MSAVPARNPAFTRWFEGPKVIDEHGEPLVGYHGTTKRSDFTLFRFRAFFTDSGELAGRYAEGAPVMAFFLRLANPIYLDAATHELGADCEELANDPSWLALQMIFGHDGVIVTDGAIRTFIAFHPEQIKSATDN